MDELIYVPGRGPLYRLDPRTKLVFAAGLCVYLAWESTTGAILLALFGLHVLCLLSKSTLSRVMPFWKTLSPLMITVILLGSVRWRAETPLLGVGPITVTQGSLWQATGLAARVASLGLGFSLFLWTTEPGDAVAGLTRLGIPFELGFAIVIALQYVVTFRRTFRQILEAQQSRGLTLSRGNPIRMARAYIPVLVPLIITALRSADSLALALQSRGFGGHRKRTCRHVLCIQKWDWVFLIATGCALFGLSHV